jgi:hypothetical protein
MIVVAAPDTIRTAEKTRGASVPLRSTHRPNGTLKSIGMAENKDAVIPASWIPPPMASARIGTSSRAAARAPLAMLAMMMVPDKILMGNMAGGPRASSFLFM